MKVSLYFALDMMIYIPSVNLTVDFIFICRLLFLLKVLNVKVLT